MKSNITNITPAKGLQTKYCKGADLLLSESVSYIKEQQGEHGKGVQPLLKDAVSYIKKQQGEYGKGAQPLLKYGVSFATGNRSKSGWHNFWLAVALFVTVFSVSSCGLYSKYERPEVDTQGLVRDPYRWGRKGYYGPTKVEVSLVLPLRFTYKSRRGGAHE